MKPDQVVICYARDLNDDQICSHIFQGDRDARNECEERPTERAIAVRQEDSVLGPYGTIATQRQTRSSRKEKKTRFSGPKFQR